MNQQNIQELSEQQLRESYTFDELINLVGDIQNENVRLTAEVKYRSERMKQMRKVIKQQADLIESEDK